MSEVMTRSSSVAEVDVSDLIDRLARQYSQLFASETTVRPSLLSYAQSLPILGRFLPSVDEKKRLIASLLEQQKVATSYQNWYQISCQIDELSDKNLWKLNPESKYYDYDLIYTSLMEMRNARLDKNYKLLLYLIRTKWVRNFGNMGDINLFQHSFVGTKRLIEEYIEECKLALDYLVNDPEVNLDDRYLLGMLIQTRKCIGRTALVLSGGSTFGIFHIGVVVALLENNLVPRIISGSSAGSIVASILCCHNNEENKLLIETIAERDFTIFSSDDFEDDEPETQKSAFRKLLKSMAHFLKYGTFFDNEGLKRTMIGFVGDLTFREAYNRTGKILNITVSPASTHEQTRLLNYLTAPNCLIWSAVCASCSLPGIFPSCSIYEKIPQTGKIQKWNNDSSVKYLDGSVDNDLPITRLSEMFNVDHIIAVQVNPHVVPVLKASISSPGGDEGSDLFNKARKFMNNTYDFLTSEVIHYLQILNEVDVYKNLSTKCISILSQQYSGDITILPDYKPTDFLKIFENPSPEFLVDFIIRGARASWPKISLIDNHCSVEFELDRAISKLRGRTISWSKSTFKNSLAVNSIHSVPSNGSLITSGNTDKESADKSPNSGTTTPYPRDRRKMAALFKGIPKMRRHNSTSAALKSNGHRRQRSTTSGGGLLNETHGSFRSGKSTTSLSAMSYQTPKRIGEATDNRAHTEEKARRISFDMSDDPSIRKAKSSSNFHSNNRAEVSPSKQQLQYNADRIPLAKDSNPYADDEDDFGFDDDYANDFDEEYDVESYVNYETSPTVSVREPSTERRESANLPKRSHNNSLTNSFIGLNRLKEANLCKSSANSSGLSLKDFNDDLTNQIMSLTSPDIRRTLTRKLSKVGKVANDKDDDNEKEHDLETDDATDVDEPTEEK